MLTLLAILVGGALGGLARHAISGAVAARIGERFPWGTFVVNATGAFAIGLLAPPLLALGVTSLQALVVVGFLGSYTTVSSFSLQTLVLLREGQAFEALGNVVLTLGACLAAVGLGFALAGGGVP